MPHANSSSQAEKYRQPYIWEFQKILDHNADIFKNKILLLQILETRRF